MSTFCIYGALLESPPPFRPVLLGHDDNGEAIELTLEDFYYHVHILGLSGRGKSRAIEYLLRQFLINEVGFTLLDPHGDIYEALVEWIAWMRECDKDFLNERTVHLFDPCDSEFCPGYNPLHVRPGGSIEARVDRFMDAVAQALGGEDPDRMPLYQLIFSAITYALAEKGLTAHETMLVLPESERDLHEWLARDLPNAAHAQVWKDIRSWKAHEYRDLVGSFYRRMHRLFRNPAAARIFGQNENVLDTLEVMDQGHTLLVNLKPDEDRGFSEMASKLLGKLMVNDFQQTARNSRPANKARPHILLIDECHDYLSGDIPRILDGTRKYGLHLVLSHQRIEQLYEAGENVADGVMAGAQTKLIFGSTYKTGAMIADEIFGSTYDLERWKESSKRPVATGQKVTTLHGAAEGIAHGKGRSVVDSVGGADGYSEQQGSGISDGLTYDYNQSPYFQIIPDSAHHSRVESEQSNRGNSHMDTWSHAVGEHENTTKTNSTNWREVFEPIYEWLPTATFTIEEQRHERSVQVQTLEKQRLFLKRAMSRQVGSGITVSFDRPVLDTDVVRQLVRALKSTTGINTPRLEVERAIAARQLAVRRSMGPRILPPERPAEPASTSTAPEAEEAVVIRTSKEWLG